jgi:hypothetical protein
MDEVVTHQARVKFEARFNLLPKNGTRSGKELKALNDICFNMFIGADGGISISMMLPCKQVTAMKIEALLWRSMSYHNPLLHIESVFCAIAVVLEVSLQGTCRELAGNL